MDMTSFVSRAVLCGVIATTLAGFGLSKTGANRRIRLLAVSVVLLTICQGSALGIAWLDLHVNDLSRSIQILQLTASVLALAVVHLLNRESTDRTNSYLRLRILETTQIPLVSQRFDGSKQSVSVGSPDEPDTRSPLVECRTGQLTEVGEQSNTAFEGVHVSRIHDVERRSDTPRSSSCVLFERHMELRTGEVVHHDDWLLGRISRLPQMRNTSFRQR